MSIVEVDYSIVLKNLSDVLDFSGVLALSKVQNISVSDVIKKGILTNIAQETLPNYKNYEYIAFISVLLLHNRRCRQPSQR